MRLDLVSLVLLVSHSFVSAAPHAHRHRSPGPHRTSTLAATPSPPSPAPPRRQHRFISSSLRPGVRPRAGASLPPPIGAYFVQPRHIVLAARSHSRERGRDANGYDDGSWRGDSHDYGGGPSLADGPATAESGDLDAYPPSPSGGHRGDDDDDSGSRSDSGSARSSGTREADPQNKAVDRDADSKAVDRDSAREVDDDQAVDRKSDRDIDDKTVDRNATSSATMSGASAPSNSSSTAQAASSNATVASTDPSSASEKWTTSNWNDCQALDAVFNNLGGSHWVNATGWTSGDGVCCAWFGVGCNADGRITSLKLPSNGLGGPLPSAVFLLDHLVTLDVSGNAITGAIPDQFGTLKTLTYLFLDSNSLTGVLPPSLAYSAALSVVHLGNNTLTGTLGLPSATNLTQLFAARNGFTSFALPQNATSIKRIAIDQNPIAGALPPAVEMPALEQFSASRCNLTGSAFDMTQLPLLKKLDLRNNQLSGEYPNPSSAPALESFAISGNAWSGAFPTGSAPSALSTCQIDALPKSACPPLEVLNDPTSLASRCSVRCRGGGPDIQAVAPGPMQANNVRTLSSMAHRRAPSGALAWVTSLVIVLLYWSLAV